MKIFVVVGTLFPFDRLVKIIDHWAGDHKNISVTAQIGKSRYIPENIVYYQMLDTPAFNKIFEESDLIIAHAGMGAILKALVSQKPIIVMPRRQHLKEHTTDHQLETVKALDKMDYVHIAWTDQDLLNYLDDLSSVRPKKVIMEFASPPLIHALRDFIDNN